MEGLINITLDGPFAGFIVRSEDAGSELKGIEALPQELAIEIFSYLPATNLESARRTSKSWKVLAESEFYRRYPEKYVNILSKRWKLNAAVKVLKEHSLIPNIEKEIAKIKWYFREAYKVAKEQKNVFNWAFRNNNFELMIAMLVRCSKLSYKIFKKNNPLRKEKVTKTLYEHFSKDFDRNLRFLQLLKPDGELQGKILRGMTDHAFSHRNKSANAIKLLQILQKNSWDEEEMPYSSCYGKTGKQLFWQSSIKRLVRTNCPVESVYPLLIKLKDTFRLQNKMPLKDEMIIYYLKFLSKYLTLENAIKGFRIIFSLKENQQVQNFKDPVMTTIGFELSESNLNLMSELSTKEIKAIIDDLEQRKMWYKAKLLTQLLPDEKLENKRQSEISENYKLKENPAKRRKVLEKIDEEEFLDEVEFLYDSNSEEETTDMSDDEPVKFYGYDGDDNYEDLK